MFEDTNDPEAEDLEIIMKLNKIERITDNIFALNSDKQNFCHLQKNGKIFVLWATKDFCLEIFDLLNRIPFYKIKIHDDSINSCHHYYDMKNHRHLIITTSDDNTLKIFNFDDFSLVLKIQNETVGKFRNACIFAESQKDSNSTSNTAVLKYYIITELSDFKIALYDFNGKFLIKISDCLFFDLWHCPELNSCQIVGSYAGRVKFYELSSGKLTKEFKCHGSLVEAAIINDLLITADEEGFLRTYSLFDDSLMNEIKVDSPITEISVWDIEYIFIFLENGFIHCYDAKTLTNVKVINPICEKVIYAESIMYPNFGPALLISGPINTEKATLTMISGEPHTST